MLLKADTLEGKKERYFTLLFCDPAFASLAGEVAPTTPAGRLLRALFQWRPTKEAAAQPEATPPVEVRPPTAATVHTSSGRFFVHSGTEEWEGFLTANNRALPLWVVGGREESSQHFNPLAPLEEAPRIPLSRTYTNQKLNNLLDSLGRKPGQRGVW